MFYAICPGGRGPQYRLIACVAALGFAAPASAFVSLSADSDLYLTGVAQATRNDNVFLSHTNAQTDTIYDLAPGLLYEFGRNSMTSGQLGAGVDFQRYAREHTLNSELPSGFGTLDYADDKLKLDFKGSYQKADLATRDVHLAGDLVKRELYHGEGKGEWVMTDKTALGTGVVYDDTVYHKAGYVDWRWVEVPVNYYYKVEPKVDLSAGVRWRNNQLGTGGINSNDYYYNVGARGEFTGKLTGMFTVGYNQFVLAKGGTLSGLGVDAGFTFQATEKTALTLNATNDFGYAAIGTAFRNPGGNVGFTSELTDKWTVRGQVGYGRFDYTTSLQRDDFYQAQIGTTWAFSKQVSLTVAYAYLRDDSNIAIDSFRNNQYSASTSLKF